jgi:hypothetical protein
MMPAPDRPDPELPAPETWQALFELIMGFRVSQLIYVAAKLDLAGLLAAGPQTVEALAQATGTQAGALYRVLRALAGYGLFAEDAQGRFVLTPPAALLQSGVPGSLRSRAVHYGGASQWAAWGDLLYSVTTGETAFQHLYGLDPWAYRAQHPEHAATFNAMMADNTRQQAAAVVAAYDFAASGTLVDVGGGHGALLAAILRANPGLQGILYDAALVLPGAEALLTAAGVRARCTLVAGDFFQAVPGGGETYLLKYILHDWDDGQALAILHNCRRVVPGHGRLLLVETLIPPGNAPHPGKMLDLQMLVELGGHERSQAEFSALLGATGFRVTRIVPADAQLSVIEAVPV